MISRQILSTVGSRSIAVERLNLCSEKSYCLQGKLEVRENLVLTKNPPQITRIVRVTEDIHIGFCLLLSLSCSISFCFLRCLSLDDSRTTSQLDEFQECLSKFTRYNSVRPLATLSYASDLYNGSSIVSR